MGIYDMRLGDFNIAENNTCMFYVITDVNTNFFILDGFVSMMNWY